MKNAYVTALTESILTNQPVEVALQNVKTIMERKGHLRLWSQVLKATCRVLESRLVSNKPQIAIGKEGAVSKETIQSALLKIGITETKDFNLKVDSSLIGGFVIRFKGVLYDTSYKQALLRLYRSINKS